MNTDCGYTGCNHPQGQCASDGACMQRQPPKHFKPQTTQLRLAITRRINDVEVDMSISLSEAPARFYAKPIPMPIQFDEPEPDDSFAMYEPWPLGVRLCAIAFLVIVASAVIAVFYFN